MFARYRLDWLAATACSLFVNPAYSQCDPSFDAQPLTAEKRSAIIQQVLDDFNTSYPLISVVEEMSDYVSQQLENGKYAELSSVADFTAQLTADLRHVSNDLHIIVYPCEGIQEDLASEMLLGSPDENFGFQKAERLIGNIGYIRFDSFNNPRTAGHTAIAAMNFLANTDAMIIDLRNNGGGDSVMAQLLSSYFFEDSTHIVNYYTREDDLTTQRWTQPWVPGPKLAMTPLFILTSRNSYSAAEGFAFLLQQLERATVVGEKTLGGAHAVKYRSYPELSINVRIPYSQHINPSTNETYINGVIPDIETNADFAFAAANIEAAKALLVSETDPEKRKVLEWVKDGYESDISPLPPLGDAAHEYKGIYQNVRISVDDGKLFIQMNGGAIREIVPMKNGIFKHKDPELAMFRVKFSRDESGQLISLQWVDSSGDDYAAKTLAIE